MSPNEYQQEALRTESHTATSARLITNYRLIQGLMGLNGEAGEAMDILKKHLFQGHGLNREHLAKELGDVAWYLAVSCDALGYSLEEVLEMNVKKLRARYPVAFDAEKSVNRAVEDE